MSREQAEELLPEVISTKQSHTLSDLINCCMAINQRILDNITKTQLLDVHVQENIHIRILKKSFET